ncbi:MAG: hypothetical protein JW881_06330 [Spirochaetales bacterium]|nr:hypothetical protein [Spirochaetales bacterium]
MNVDIVAGIIILSLALGLLVFLLLYSRFIINTIAGKKITSLREIMKEIYGGKSS